MEILALAPQQNRETVYMRNRRRLYQAAGKFRGRNFDCPEGASATNRYGKQRTD